MTARNFCRFVGSAVLASLLALSSASAQVFEQKYAVEAVITPTTGEQPAIRVSEVWETVVYRDSARHQLVARVFGEALHFEIGDDDYFALKRSYSGSSAGTFDPLRECLGLDSLSDYDRAGFLSSTCTLKTRTPMVVKVGDHGGFERLRRASPADAYPEFAVEFTITPTTLQPSYDLAARFPWIEELPVTEPSVLPPTIPEGGNFIPAKHYQKDFVVKP
ncbi:hypothetical protein PRN20_13950 [Devosia sp. ZB163]|uniref:hypothetical protein n=1 Tax=Devosia sp. ZB163 TaxID=3025938 RepID=UPI0023622DDD|nr:hypothetical protein [Devosia sp. ZB163]MDC9824834.1 hypothetical protein [Devosia sp. ZB163]